MRNRQIMGEIASFLAMTYYRSALAFKTPNVIARNEAISLILHFNNFKK